MNLRICLLSTAAQLLLVMQFLSLQTVDAVYIMMYYPGCIPLPEGSVAAEVCSSEGYICGGGSIMIQMGGTPNSKMVYDDVLSGGRHITLNGTVYEGLSIDIEWFDKIEVEYDSSGYEVLSETVLDHTCKASVGGKECKSCSMCDNDEAASVDCTNALPQGIVTTCMPVDPIFFPINSTMKYEKPNSNLRKRFRK